MAPIWFFYSDQFFSLLHRILGMDCHILTFNCNFNNIYILLKMKGKINVLHPQF